MFRYGNLCFVFSDKGDKKRTRPLVTSMKIKFLSKREKKKKALSDHTEKKINITYVVVDFFQEMQFHEQNSSARL